MKQRRWTVWTAADEVANSHWLVKGREKLTPSHSAASMDYLADRHRDPTPNNTMAQCNLGQLGWPLPPCFSRCPLPAPHTFRPVASITTFTGPLAMLNALATVRSTRRETVVSSGTGTSGPSRRRIEASMPSVWRQDWAKTSRRIKPVSIAIAEYCGRPRRQGIFTHKGSSNCRGRPECHGGAIHAVA
jgi:hypothetical protein